MNSMQESLRMVEGTVDGQGVEIRRLRKELAHTKGNIQGLQETIGKLPNTAPVANAPSKERRSRTMAIGRDTSDMRVDLGNDSSKLGDEFRGMRRYLRVSE